MSSWRLDGERCQLIKSQAVRKVASRSPWRHNLSLSGSRSRKNQKLLDGVKKAVEEAQA